MKKNLIAITMLAALVAMPLKLSAQTGTTPTPAPTSPPPPVTTAPAPPKPHHKISAIHHAIHSLEKAKAYLQAANHDFGGHRAAALQACDSALAQLKLAVQYDKAQK